MVSPDLSSRSLLVLGAETELGTAISEALANAGAHLALVADSNDPSSAYSVQRLARRLSEPGHMALHQAIDAANEMAVRVMVRQVGKDLGRLDAAVFCAELGHQTSDALALTLRFAAREMARTGRGLFVIAVPGGELHATAAVGEVDVQIVEAEGRDPREVAADVVRAVAAAPASR